MPKSTCPHANGRVNVSVNHQICPLQLTNQCCLKWIGLYAYKPYIETDTA